MEPILPAKDKALAINMDPLRYGSFAEIGAGQEVARWFFKVGGASRTIAKTISAYDMTFSDAIYGAEETKRYVCESRLFKMLNKEYKLLKDRLWERRSNETTFFAYANTVAAKSTRVKEAHGWMGLRFQTTPQGEPNDIIVHFRLLDQRNVHQQEAVGLVGLNLVYGAFYYRDNPKKLLLSLMDNLEAKRVEIDMVRFTGPDFKHFDNRLLGLYLVELGMTSEVFFLPNGQIAQASDLLFDKNVLIQRGSFHPVTHVNLDMFRCGVEAFKKEPGINPENVVALMEITMNNLLEGGQLDVSDFIHRIDLLSSLGHTVVVSSHPDYYHLRAFIKHYTQKKVGLILGVGHLKELFDEANYKTIEGGILEALGKLFVGDVKLFVYPAQSLSIDRPGTQAGSLYTAETFAPPQHLHTLYKHFRDTHQIEPLIGFVPEFLSINSRDVLKKLRSKDVSWEQAVPVEIASLIKQRRLFGVAS